MAGDRWLVTLEARLDIRLDKVNLDPFPEKEKVLKALRASYGTTIRYRYKQHKHFVSLDQKERVFHDFLETFKKNIIPYLSRRGFARSLVLSKQRELEGRKPMIYH